MKAVSFVILGMGVWHILLSLGVFQACCEEVGVSAPLSLLTLIRGFLAFGC